MRNFVTCLFGLVTLVVGAKPALAQAQVSEDPVENARIQLGPLGVTPSIAVTNLGLDSNVFNTVEDPKQDFTLTASPQLNAWFRAGRSRTHVDGQIDFVYFQTYSTERSIDGNVNGRLEMAGNRITPWVAGGFA